MVTRKLDPLESVLAQVRLGEITVVCSGAEVAVTETGKVPAIKPTVAAIRPDISVAIFMRPELSLRNWCIKRVEIPCLRQAGKLQNSGNVIASDQGERGNLQGLLRCARNDGRSRT